MSSCYRALVSTTPARTMEAVKPVLQIEDIVVCVLLGLRDITVKEVS